MEGWAGASVRLTDNTQQLQRGSLWRPKPAWEAHPPALEKWAEATGSDSPDSEKREAEGGAGRRRKGYFKAHKNTVSWTAQDEHWLLPKLCRYVQILCKLATQRWQGHLLTAWLWSLLGPSASVSFRELSRGAVTCQAARREGTGSALPQLPAHFPSGGPPPGSALDPTLCIWLLAWTVSSEITMVAGSFWSPGPATPFPLYG